MNLDDIESVCKLVPDAMVVATHLDSVNHALLSREDIRKFVNSNSFLQVRVSGDGESIIV